MGPSLPLKKASGPLRSSCSAPPINVPNEPSASPVAAGSVASASTSSAGRSPRSRSRENFGGMFMTNWTLPWASRSRPSSSVRTWRTKSKYVLLRIAWSTVRPCGPSSANSTAAGRWRGSLLMAKPNNVSWIKGMPSIMAKVSRSRRICVNSLTTMPTSLANEKFLMVRAGRSCPWNCP